jgi:hypothetical protein
MRVFFLLGECNSLLHVFYHENITNGILKGGPVTASIIYTVSNLQANLPSSFFANKRLDEVLNAGQ